MVVLFYIAVIACVVNGHMDVVLEKSGNNIWFIYPFLQGLQFAAGMSVLIYGVRQFIAEITAAFVAISEKYLSLIHIFSEGLIDELGGIHDAYDKLYKMLDLTETK